MEKKKVKKAEKKYVSIMVPTDDMYNILEGNGEDRISDEVVGNSRWSVHHTLRFRRNGKVYEADYSKGATEMQDECPWAYEDEVECFELREEKVTRMEYVRVEA